MTYVYKPFPKWVTLPSGERLVVKSEEEMEKVLGKPKAKKAEEPKADEAPKKKRGRPRKVKTEE